MKDVLIILLYLCYVIWCASSGATEAILYSKRGASAFKWNEHLMFDIQRISVFCMIVFAVLSCKLLINSYGVVLAISFILKFPFIHDGFYYVTRSKIDDPSYNFFSSSKESTSKFELSFSKRTCLFIVGVLLPNVFELIKPHAEVALKYLPF